VPSMLSLYRHRWSIALAGAAAADTLTFLVMGTAHELNPIAATFPAAAIVAKFLLVVAILSLPLAQYGQNVRIAGALAWSIGTLSNIAVLTQSA
jgi:hypothetical protein